MKRKREKTIVSHPFRFGLLLLLYMYHYRQSNAHLKVELWALFSQAICQETGPEMTSNWRRK